MLFTLICTYIIGVLFIALLVRFIPQLNKNIHYILSTFKNPIVTAALLWPFSVLIIVGSYLYCTTVNTINYISGNKFKHDSQKQHTKKIYTYPR